MQWSIATASPPRSPLNVCRVSYFIQQHSTSVSVLGGKHMIHQRRFAGAKVSGDESDGHNSSRRLYSFVCGCWHSLQELKGWCWNECMCSAQAAGGPGAQRKPHLLLAAGMRSSLCSILCILCTQGHRHGHLLVV
jgi:hypothetical protein